MVTNQYGDTPHTTVILSYSAQPTYRATVRVIFHCQAINNSNSGQFNLFLQLGLMTVLLPFLVYMTSSVSTTLLQSQVLNPSNALDCSYSVFHSCNYFSTRAAAVQVPWLDFLYLFIRNVFRVVFEQCCR